MLESPQSFVVRAECEKAAWQHGFRRPLGIDGGWAAFGSTTAQGTIHLAAAEPQGPWFFALDHAGVVDELDVTATDMPGPGLARYRIDSLAVLYATLPRIYQLSVCLPDAPLRAFQAKIRDLPQTTEAERLIVQRIGQDMFRTRLLAYWQGRCPLTGITDEALLRASHIIPWKDCTNDAERLNVHNGLLLSALWDAAFDRGLVTFDDNGNPLFSSQLSEAAKVELRWQTAIRLTEHHKGRLSRHRNHCFVTAPQNVAIVA